MIVGNILLSGICIIFLRVGFSSAIKTNDPGYSGNVEIDVKIDDTIYSFTVDTSIADFGASDFCDKFNVNKEVCVRSIVSVSQSALATRRRRPQTFIDVTSSNIDIFTNPVACTDNFHVTGRCLLVYSLMRYVVDGGVPGDYVEAGVHVGDSAAAVAQLVKSRNSAKRMFLYDSFLGMPEAQSDFDGAYAMELSPSGDPEGKGWGHEASAANVAARIAALGLTFPQVIIREGWFNETFQTEPKPHGSIAMLMVDGDWYGSVLDSLESFYDKVSPGGVIFIDDYGYWEGARRALNSFFRSHPDIEMPLFERYGPDMLWWYKGIEHNRPN